MNNVKFNFIVNFNLNLFGETLLKFLVKYLLYLLVFFLFETNTVLILGSEKHSSC